MALADFPLMPSQQQELHKDGLAWHACSQPQIQTLATRQAGAGGCNISSQVMI